MKVIFVHKAMQGGRVLLWLITTQEGIFNNETRIHLDQLMKTISDWFPEELLWLEPTRIKAAGLKRRALPTTVLDASEDFHSLKMESPDV